MLRTSQILEMIASVDMGGFILLCIGLVKSIKKKLKGWFLCSVDQKQMSGYTKKILQVGDYL
jgi:hypothetical protein